ncbi:MAG: hypothetical protein ABSG83_19885 [Roseiarcus sp.]
MSELDELERDLLAAADIWFSQKTYQQLRRLFEIAREISTTREIVLLRVEADRLVKNYEDLSSIIASMRSVGQPPGTTGDI